MITIPIWLLCLMIAALLWAALLWAAGWTRAQRTIDRIFARELRADRDDGCNAHNSPAAGGTGATP